MRPIAAALLLLAGCSAAPTGGDKTANTTVPEGPIDAGRWEVKVSQAVPPRIGDRMLKGRTDPLRREQCITARQAATPTPELLMTIGDAIECKHDTFSMDQGNINARLSCDGRIFGVRSVPAVAFGNYARRSYWLQIEQRLADVTMTTRIDARRLGECDR